MMRKSLKNWSCHRCCGIRRLNMMKNYELLILHCYVRERNTERGFLTHCCYLTNCARLRQRMTCFRCHFRCCYSCCCYRKASSSCAESCKKECTTVMTTGNLVYSRSDLLLLKTCADNPGLNLFRLYSLMCCYLQIQTSYLILYTCLLQLKILLSDGRSWSGDLCCHRHSCHL